MDLTALRLRLQGASDARPRDDEIFAAPATSDDAMDLVDRPLTPAAVLVPLMHGDGAGVLLTLRTPHLRDHAGQVAFPGGRTEPDDASAEATALREAHEEIGLEPGQVELAGRLPDYVTGTAYRITPVLGLLPSGLALSPCEDEVAAIFTLPLSTLLDPAAPQRRRREWRGRQREFWVWPHPEHYVWGATAAILVHLAQRLRAQGT
ncbi:MAG TPA: CoA pyrophosphatase [Acetobacteraceae bacterium]